MQRLLRGRALYICLAAVLAGLYAYLFSTGQGKLASGRVLEEPVAFGANKSVELLPKPVDVDVMLQLAEEKPLAALAASLATVATAALIVAGFFISILGLIRGRLKALWQFPLGRLSEWSIGEMARILLLILLIAGLMPFGRFALLSFNPQWELDMHLWVPVSMLILDTFVVLAVFSFAEGKRRTGAWRAVGFIKGSNARSCQTGMRYYAVALPWLLMLLLLIVKLAGYLNWEPPAEPIQELIFNERRPWVFLLTALLACIVGPLAEECFFRGVLYTSLRGKVSRWAAMLISGACFGMIHTNVLGFLPIMLLGCLLAYIYERTGSIAGSVLVHVIHNSLLMGMALIYRYVTPLQ